MGGPASVGFNSLFGILAVQTIAAGYRELEKASFNSLFGILAVQTQKFCGDDIPVVNDVSIPCSEFWLFRPVPGDILVGDDVVFQFPVRNSGCSDMGGQSPTRRPRPGFNSLFGILAVQTSSPTAWLAPTGWFQFPVRNSGCSDNFPERP